MLTARAPLLHSQPAPNRDFSPARGSSTAATASFLSRDTDPFGPQDDPFAAESSAFSEDTGEDSALSSPGNDPFGDGTNPFGPPSTVHGSTIGLDESGSEDDDGWDLGSLPSWDGSNPEV